MQQYREASPERSQLLRILTHVLFGLEAIDEELVFKCSEKIYEEEPALVLRCFVDDKGVIGHLNIYHTAQHLRRLTQREPSAYRRNALPIQYLSVVTPHIPSGTGSLRLPEDHNLAQILALLYIETINEAEAFCRQNEHENENQNENERENQNENEHDKDNEHDKETQKENQIEIQSKSEELSRQNIADPAVIAQYTADLRALLRQNASYDPEKLLEALPAGKMLLERCIVLSRLHEHEQALTILLYSLRNVETAFQYCADVCELPDSRDNRVYHALVHV